MLISIFIIHKFTSFSGNFFFFLLLNEIYLKKKKERKKGFRARVACINFDLDFECVPYIFLKAKIK